MQKIAQKEIVDYRTINLIKDILVFIRPYRFRFWLATFIRFVRDLASLYPAFAFASLVDILAKYPETSTNKIYWILLLWLLSTMVRSLANYFSKTIGFGIGERVGIDATLKAISHMFKLDMAWHEKENSGNKIKRIQNASKGFEQIIRIWFGYIISIIVNLITVIVVIAHFDTTVVLLLIVFCLVYFLVSGTMRKKAGSAAREVSIEDEKVNGLLFEGINNIRTVKVMSMVKVFEGYLYTNTTELFKKIKNRIFWFQSRQALLTFLGSAVRVGIILFIIHGMLEGRYELGFLVLFNGYFSDLTTAIDELSETSVEVTVNRLNIARMKNILNEPINIDDDTSKVTFPENWQKLSFEKVSFSYGDNKVLDNITFDIKRGEKVGIVGLSGAGKSTLFKLLLKEREEFDGGVCFDDLSIKDITKSSYFKKVSVVLQDTEVFNFSLKDNITITNDKEINNTDLLEQSLVTAHLKEVAEKLPEGIDTLIGEKGIKLSGGERQRLGIARAVFKEPQILLLDEATSHLDLESEEKIRDSLHSFFQKITAIVIAHRLTTIKLMDRILVLEDGRIIESGSFDELYTKKGRFYELWEKQKI